MFITMLKSKIHNAVITKCELHYEGSISIDEDIIKKAKLREFEKVLIVNKNTAARFETYVIKAPAGSKEFGLNGGAARLAIPGDPIIIFSFAQMTEEEADNFKPVIVIMKNEKGE